MAIVSNTSPSSYLVLIGEVGILQQLYGKIYVPNAVLSELNSPDAPQVLRDWVQSHPAWLIVQDPAVIQASLALHAEETHAISLAMEVHAERLIIDEQAGRESARSLGVPVVGTVGLLDLAAERGFVDLPLALKRLNSTNFRIAQSLIEEVLQRDGLRRQKTSPPVSGA